MNKYEWSWVGLWALATVVALAIGFAGQIPLPIAAQSTAAVPGNPISGFPVLDLQFAVTRCMPGSLLGGLLLGMGQWLMLRRLPGDTFWSILWVPATALGAIAGVILTWAIVRNFALWQLSSSAEPGIVDLAIAQAVILTVLGLLIGVFQMLVLWLWTRKAYLWAIVMPATWFAGSIVHTLVYFALVPQMSIFVQDELDMSATDIYQRVYYEVPSVAAYLAWAAGGLVIGVLSGMGLRTLLNTREAGAEHSREISEDPSY